MAEQNPILNNPYEEPRFHYDTDIDNNLDYSKVLEGRRPFSTNICINPQERTQGQIFSGSNLYDADDPDAKFINTIRDEVKKWREGGYQRTTRVTRELLNFWFNNPERQSFHKLFFCQREAVETAVYLNEIADFDPNKGRSILRNLEERLDTISDNPDDILPRTAFKMATGTGKTFVMAMIILYNYFNKKEYHNDTRFADHFLIVTPGITIKERLGVLYVDDKKNYWDCNDYYNQRNLIPQSYRYLIGGLNEMITITNYHVFEPKVLQGKKSSPMDGKMVYNGETHKMEKQNDKEEISNVLSRVLGRNMKGKRIIVINDEAHHCYLPKGKEKATENSEEDENVRAMVWYEGLRQMKRLGYKIQHVYDLSATPYYLKGSGHEAYTLFPWVVSDFGLVDAIESGLVKIPFLPSYDDSKELNEPVLRNIYEHIKDKLPKKGQKSQRKADREAAEKDGKDVSKQIEQAPNLPALLTMALDQFRKDYEEYENGMRLDGEAGKDLFTTPPVFIVVCNNTTVSKEVFKYIAGYESKEPTQ